MGGFSRATRTVSLQRVSARHRSPRRLVLPVAFLALLGAGCGQYAGVHQDVVAVAEPSLASDGQSPPAGAGGGNPSNEIILGEDGANGPDDAQVVGGSDGGGTLPGGGGEGQPGEGGGGEGNGNTNGGNGNTNGGNGEGNGETPDPNETPNSVPASADPSDPGALAELISEATQEGFRYNSTILPAGFPFLGCPVQGAYAYSDDYGAARYSGGYHPHAGNDIFSDLGTAIVAPFSGYVERVPNTLGGLAVRVHGDQGYVYMAHLVAYGITGKSVPAGTVVGFVGTSGNAQGTHPHNHFEWHPDQPETFDEVLEGANGAVNPFPYLRVVCPPD